MQPYFGTDDELPKHHVMQAGILSCLYERGSLRYISIGGYEIVRMLYFAIRDENWLTIPFTINSEKVSIHSDSFTIKYILKYKTETVDYEVNCLLEGKSDNSIRFVARGKSLTEFKRNRIGICLHHPIKEHLGQSVTILKINGKSVQSTFPELISPHQLFKNIKALQWKLVRENQVYLSFEGENFETEDQRNWTDCSFKTYGTPLDLPFPVVVKKGDQIHQEINLSLYLSSNSNLEISNKTANQLFAIKGKKYEFPKIGYGRYSKKKLSLLEINAFKNIPFDHYRVEIRFEQFWKRNLLNALSESLNLKTRLELVVFFKDEIENELADLFEVIKGNETLIDSILMLHQQYKVTPITLLRNEIQYIKKNFPQIKIGYGTDVYFAELNRNPPPETEENIDFISYSVNPQVHSSDFRSLIENVEGLKYTIDTGKIIAPGKAIFISPLTLKPRYNPNSTNKIIKDANPINSNVDSRQNTEFTAAWMLLSLRYLSGSKQITLFETIGKNGLIHSESNESSSFSTFEAIQFYPVYNYLEKIHAFKPISILNSHFPNPLITNGLILENATGDQLTFIIDFEQGSISEVFIANKNISNQYNF